MSPEPKKSRTVDSADRKAEAAALTCDADVVSEDEPAGGRHEAAHHHREGDLAAVAVAGARPAAAVHLEYHSPAVHLCCSPPLQALVDGDRSIDRSAWSFDSEQEMIAAPQAERGESSRAS